MCAVASPRYARPRGSQPSLLLLVEGIKPFDRPVPFAFSQVGANGAGKSTLLRLIAGKRRSSEGAATVLGEDAFECTANCLRVNLVTADWEEELTLPVRQLVGNAVAAARANESRVERLLEALGIPAAQHAALIGELESESAAPAGGR